MNTSDLPARLALIQQAWLNEDPQAHRWVTDGPVLAPDGTLRIKVRSLTSGTRVMDLESRPGSNEIHKITVSHPIDRTSATTVVLVGEPGA